MMSFIIKTNGKEFDISQLISRVTFRDLLNDGCSKLEFSFVNNGLNFTNGSVVSFIYDSINIFYGYIFTVTKLKGNEITCIAYDQLRYCKARDTITISDDTAATLASKMCNYFNLKKGTISDTRYKLATDIMEDDTWLDIIYSAIDETKKNMNKKYMLRDEFGQICLRDIDDLQMNLVLGDKSLVYDFNYSKSIDSDFYNQIKIGLNNDYSSNQNIIKGSSESISKYGLLQLYEPMYNANVSQARSQAETLLEQYNKESETLTLSCLGDPRVRAGSSFYGRLKDIAYDKRLIVRSVTHDFVPVHTMEVEAML